eukprot:319766-Rhodomonas_salina.9
MDAITACRNGGSARNSRDGIPRKGWSSSKTFAFLLALEGALNLTIQADECYSALLSHAVLAPSSSTIVALLFLMPSSYHRTWQARTFAILALLCAGRGTHGPSPREAKNSNDRGAAKTIAQAPRGTRAAAFVSDSRSVLSG